MIFYLFFFFFTLFDHPSLFKVHHQNHKKQKNYQKEVHIVKHRSFVLVKEFQYGLYFGRSHLLLLFQFKLYFKSCQQKSLQIVLYVVNRLQISRTFDQTVNTCHLNLLVCSCGLTQPPIFCLIAHLKVLELLVNQLI